MGEPRAITYKEVGDTDKWNKINAITGAGCPVGEEACIDITDLSEAKRAQIDSLIKKDKKKEGN